MSDINDMELALASPADVDQVVELVRAASDWLKTKGVAQWSDAVPHSLLEEEVNRRELLVVRKGAEIVAAVQLTFKKDELWESAQESAIYLHRLVTRESMRGQNFGSTVLSMIEAHARNENARVIRLSCDHANPYLPAFYLRSGYKQVGLKHFAPWQMDFVLFEKEL